VNELSGYTSRVSEMFTVFEDMRNSRFRHNFKPKDLTIGPEIQQSAFVSEGTMQEVVTVNCDVEVGC
jgi:hypothetical protein